MNLEYAKPTLIHLKNHAQFNEKWLQDRIVEDPTILGLGDLELRDVERLQPKAGRLDLLLGDSETDKRFEVELMLGAVDASHIIRTLEYWDIERKRYPQYDHCAVIVAEDITSRFLNVIGLFNSAVPIIAIQLNALQVGDKIVLNFTKVLDEVVLGDEGDDPPEITNRAYWEQKGSPKSLAILDKCLEILRDVSPNCELGYKKYYIGITVNGQTNNFVVFRPKKQFLSIAAKVSDRDAWKERIDEAGFVLMNNRKRLAFRIPAAELEEHRELLKELFAACYQEQ